MKNLRIRTSIALLLVLPLLGLIGFAGTMVLDKRHTANEMQSLESLAKLAPTISSMINELQTERSLAAVFIASKGKRFKEDYPAQFEATDQRLDELLQVLHGYDASAYNVAAPQSGEATGEGDQEQAAQQANADAEDGPRLIALPAGVDNPLVAQMNRAIFAIHDAQKVRTLVQRRFAKVLKLSTIYGDAIEELIGVIEQMGGISSDARTTNAIIAYTSLLEAKESAGMERAVGAAGFSAGRFKFFLYTRFIELIARQETLLETFKINAEAEQARTLEETLAGPSVEAVNKMRAIAIATYQDGFDLQETTLDAWDEAISAKIDLFKQVEDRVSSSLIERVDHIRVSAENTFKTELIITLALLAVTLGFVVFVVRSITGPVNEMAGAMTALANGELETDVPARGRTNEIGEMSDAVQMFKDNAIKNKELEAANEREKQKSEKEKRELMLQMADDFQASVGGVVESVSSAATEMQSSAQSLSSTAEETSKQSAAVAAASEQATSNVQTVASAAEELTSSISEISRQVAQSTEISNAAVTEVEGANEKVQGLADAANKIGEVVALITDIADQTNLLALNATIEAARAGEAGKGFAVVASEVKNLANQTAKATEEISSQIGGIQGATQEAVHAIESIGGTINQMSEIASTIASAVEEQGAATQEIARNVEQAAAGTQEVSSNIANVNQAADETGQSADQMLSAAQDLSQQSELLRGEVSKFLDNIRKG